MPPEGPNPNHDQNPRHTSEEDFLVQFAGLQIGLYRRPKPSYLEDFGYLEDFTPSQLSFFPAVTYEFTNIPNVQPCAPNTNFSVNRYPFAVNGHIFNDTQNVQSRTPNANFYMNKYIAFDFHRDIGGYSINGFHQYQGRRISNIWDQSTDFSSNRIPYHYYDSVIRLRQRLNDSMQLSDLSGRIASAAMNDKSICDFLKRKLDERKPEDVHMIFMEVIDNLHDLMVHHSANTLVQKLVVVLSPEQMTILVAAVTSTRKFLTTCENKYGSQVIQKMIDLQYLIYDQMITLVSALKEIVMPLSTNAAGCDVIIHCLHNLPSLLVKEIVEEIVKNCLYLATDRWGCRVVNECIDYADEKYLLFIFARITANSLMLAEHSYGNYVLDHILLLGIPEVVTAIINELRGHYVDISRSQSGSQVVSNCLLDEDHATIIINEIINNPNSVELLSKDSYGNYVIQSALEWSQGHVRKNLVNVIKSYEETLRNDMYGKRVVEKLEGD